MRNNELYCEVRAFGYRVLFCHFLDPLIFRPRNRRGIALHFDICSVIRLAKLVDAELDTSPHREEL